MRRIQLVIAAVAIGLFCSGSKAQEETATDQDESGDDRVCVNIRTIRNFEAFDDENVYVREGSSRHFLFVMRHRCSGLRNSVGIAVKGRSSRVCSDSLGEIVYSDRAGVGRTSSCPIDTIIAVDSKEAAESLASSGGE